MDLAILLGILSACVGLLGLERAVLVRARRRLSLCVAVTGTRGKSSVTRLIAAGLRGDGLCAFAKTTGSRPVLIAPDGSERRIRRWGGASILEQRRVLLQAAARRKSALVVEVMSVHPETYEHELGRVLCPDILVVTNIRLDHTDALGDSLPEAARVFAGGVPRSARVLAIREECPTEFFEILQRRGVSFVPVQADESCDDLSYPEWPGNVALAVATCAEAGVAREPALAGMRQVRPDFGALTAWRVQREEGKPSWTFVNGFAANDPQSTFAVLDAAVARWGEPGTPEVGILNLRGDRGDRTAQWVRALTTGPVRFHGLLVLGHAPWAVRKRIRTVYPEVRVMRGNRLADVMATVSRMTPRGGLVFGFGNIAGPATRLVEKCDREAERL